jgi:hypothetical protein
MKIGTAKQISNVAMDIAQLRHLLGEASQNPLKTR